MSIGLQIFLGVLVAVVGLPVLKWTLTFIIMVIKFPGIVIDTVREIKAEEAAKAVADDKEEE